jgi:hypothetical protein
VFLCNGFRLEGPLLSGIIIESPLEVLIQKVIKASVYIGDLIFQQTQKRVEIVVPGLTEASDRRDPLRGDSRMSSKHFAMDTGSEAGMTVFYVY